ncbi:hypothetical protein PCASD_25087 [Puccinia coronata f. sp. avenae]|uniref:Uncharacterized protein n=1 Tax=Puccinia coronata f. sp. avenae TaxID=200324 RepID=A0A2N5TUV2_9BASI|nr:hypothetical protein PCASD_25087 [Puccinia coronata f. sp. avenae]
MAVVVVAHVSVTTGHQPIRSAPLASGKNGRTLPTPFLLARSHSLALLHLLALARRLPGSHLLAGSQACTLARTRLQAGKLVRLYARTLARLLALACRLAGSRACTLARSYAHTLALARSHLPGSPSLAGLQTRTLVRLQACRLARSHARSTLARLLALACSHARTCSLAALPFVRSLVVLHQVSSSGF